MSWWRQRTEACRPQPIFSWATIQMAVISSLSLFLWATAIITNWKISAPIWFGMLPAGERTAVPIFSSMRGTAQVLRSLRWLRRWRTGRSSTSLSVRPAVSQSIMPVRWRKRVPMSVFIPPMDQKARSGFWQNRRTRRSSERTPRFHRVTTRFILRLARLLRSELNQLPHRTVWAP